MKIDSHLWHALATPDVAAKLGVDPVLGLSPAEVQKRLLKYGPNQLRPEKWESIWDIFLEEVREPMILLLLVTGVIYAIWGGLADALTILVVILLLVGVEVLNEYRAKSAITALRKLSEPTTSVLRDGQVIEVATTELVPGDLVVLRAGQRVPADIRLLEAYGLAVDESTLTGESVPVEKDAGVILAGDAPLAERRNTAFAGTVITRGRGSGVVVATGMATELGRVADLAREVREPRTPLQQTMRELTRWMVWLALGFSIIVPLLGWLLAGQSGQQMLLTGLSLAFATIPEELPIIITMVLALGSYRLSREHAIVKRLEAAETLGAVTTIVTDKTGTLTENRMEVNRIYPEDQKKELLRVAVLASDVVEGSTGLSGDPLEVGLLSAAKENGLDPVALRRSYQLRDEFTFDNVRKMMSMVYSQDGSLYVAVKGAPEAVLDRSLSWWKDGAEIPLDENRRREILEAGSLMASDGLRIIAVAEKKVTKDHLSQEEAESGLAFTGLVGLFDPPRPEAREAVEACQSAGVRVVMVTGDHPLTARSIADLVGLDGKAGLISGPELDTISDENLPEIVERATIFARTTPEHKLRIVQALHHTDQVVAVTGDGVNDAPALAAADVGVAMGETGTDVAREAADVILADDNFVTIVGAIREGRLLFANLRKGVRYYLACKLALVLVTLLPVLLGVPVPFAPIQIILMELLMDLAASAAFVIEPPEGDLMKQPPRERKSRFMDKAMVSSIFSSAVGLFVAVSLVYLVTWYGGAGIAVSQTAAFVTWLLGHVFLAFNLRSEREPLLKLGPLSNRLMVIWGVATALFVVLATFVPGVQAAIKTTSLSPATWALVIGMALVGTFWIEARKWLFHHPRR